MVLNQAVRDSDFDSSKEFIPVSLRDRADLHKAKETEPVFGFRKMKKQEG